MNSAIERLWNSEKSGVMIVACAFGLVVAATASFARVTPGQACASSKQKAAGKLASRYLSCWSKAAKRDAPVDSECQAQAAAKFASVVARLEAAGGCVTIGDGASIDAYMAFVARSIAAGSPSAPEDCSNGVDDNGNDEVDCDDVTCINGPACIEMECADGVDNDNDAVADCGDEDCLSAPACTESDCADGTDNDNDSTTDCADLDCYDRAGCNTCGDNVAEGLESCDGADLREATCVSLGYPGGGALTCYPFCAFDVSGCAP